MRGKSEARENGAWERRHWNKVSMAWIRREAGDKQKRRLSQDLPFQQRRNAFMYCEYYKWAKRKMRKKRRASLMA